MNASGPQTLKGDRNQCPTCRLLFNSTAAFEKHRTGDFAKHTRRCLTQDEMKAKGMAISGSGFWVTALNPMWEAA